MSMGLKKYYLFFLAVSLHISIERYIRSFHVKGFASSFETLDLRAFQKSSRRARKTSAPKFIKEKSEKSTGHSLPIAAKRNPSARVLYFF